MVVVEMSWRVRLTMHCCATSLHVSTVLELQYATSADRCTILVARDLEDGQVHFNAPDLAPGLSLGQQWSQICFECVRRSPRKGGCIRPRRL